MVEYTGWKPALTAALSKVGETIAVEQIALTAPLAYTLPTGTPSGVVHRVVFTQDGTGGHTVTYDGQPLTIDTTAGESTLFEIWPSGDAIVRRGTVSSPPPTLQRAEVTPTGTGPRFIDKIGGLLYGVIGATGAIHASTDGVTWTQVCATWPGVGVETWISRMIPTADGEMLAMSSHELRKSIGWAVDPATATWSAPKITHQGSSIFNGFGLDGDGTKFIVSTYATPIFADSRYVYISLDAGSTWTIAYDSLTLHGAIAAPEDSHIHGVCYDPWSDRFYVSEGHGPAGGIYSSSDGGATWVGPMRVEVSQPPSSLANNGPTVLVATDDGIVCGSDNKDNGLFGIQRRESPADERIIPTWRMHTGRDGLVAFAQRGWRDPETGLVYVTFRSEYNDTPLAVAAGTAGGGGIVYEHPAPVVGGADRFAAVGTVGDGDLFLYAEINSTPYHIRGTLTAPGHTQPTFDTGNTLRGNALWPSGLASGRANALAANSVAVGHGATVSESATGSLAVGYSSAATSTGATALGNAAAAGNAGTAIGSGAKTTTGVAVGRNAETIGNYGTAVGNNARTNLDVVALGAGADSSAWSRSVAIGKGVTASASDQVAMGARHLELIEVADPTAPATNKARIFLRDDGAGKTQVCVRFATGAVQVIATEP